MVNKVVTLNNVALELESRIRRRIRKFTPADPLMFSTLERIGIVLRDEIRMNIRKKRIIDTGNLWNRVGYNFFRGRGKIGIEVGVRKVPYAKLHEFGTDKFSESQRRAMFATLREEGKLTGTSKNIVRGNRFKARPYVRPALKKHKRKILREIRSLLKANPSGN